MEVKESIDASLINSLLVQVSWLLSFAASG